MSGNAWYAVSHLLMRRRSGESECALVPKKSEPINPMLLAEAIRAAFDGLSVSLVYEHDRDDWKIEIRRKNELAEQEKKKTTKRDAA